MTSIASLHVRAFSQYLLLIAVVFGIGYYKHNGFNFDDLTSQDLNFWKTSEKNSEKVTPHRLTATYTSANAYPEIKFGSDKAWHKYLKTSSYPRYDAEGNIGDHTVGFNIELRPNGTFVGRYYNTNGIKLDVNGYVEKSSGDLHIRLGHGSELSNWTLSPITRESTASKYVYEGVWGRKNKSSRIIITPESN